VAVAVLLGNSAVLVVDYQFGLLVAADLPCKVNSLPLGFGVLDGALASADFDIPATARGGDNMMRFGHDGSYQFFIDAQAGKGLERLSNQRKVGTGSCRALAGQRLTRTVIAVQDGNANVSKRTPVDLFGSWCKRSHERPVRNNET